MVPRTGASSEESRFPAAGLEAAVEPAGDGVGETMIDGRTPVELTTRGASTSLLEAPPSLVGEEELGLGLGCTKNGGRIPVGATR